MWNFEWQVANLSSMKLIECDFKVVDKLVNYGRLLFGLFLFNHYDWLQDGLHLESTQKNYEVVPARRFLLVYKADELQTIHAWSVTNQFKTIVRPTPQLSVALQIAIYGGPVLAIWNPGWFYFSNPIPRSYEKHHHFMIPMDCGKSLLNPWFRLGGV